MQAESSIRSNLCVDTQTTLIFYLSIRLPLASSSPLQTRSIYVISLPSCLYYGSACARPVDAFTMSLVAVSTQMRMVNIYTYCMNSCVSLCADVRRYVLKNFLSPFVEQDPLCRANSVLYISCSLKITLCLIIVYFEGRHECLISALHSSSMIFGQFSTFLMSSASRCQTSIRSSLSSPLVSIPTRERLSL